MKKTDIKQKANAVKKNISAVYLALKDKDTPLTAKIVAAITVAYALSPIDLIPDFIPILGYLDDVVILPLLITLCIKMIPKDVMNRSKNQADTIWQNGKPKKWYFAIPIIILWLLLFWLIFKALRK